MGWWVVGARGFWTFFGAIVVAALVAVASAARSSTAVATAGAASLQALEAGLPEPTTTLPPTTLPTTTTTTLPPTTTTTVFAPTDDRLTIFGDSVILGTQVVLPGALPHIFTGLAVGMGVAWVSLIAAEMISGQFGIGYFTWEAYSLISYAEIALGMITIGVLGLLCSGAIRLLAKFSMPWLAFAGGHGGRG